MRVAFATEDGKRVDAHFGCTSTLEVYEVDALGHRLERVHSFSPGQQDGQEDKLQPRIEAVADCMVAFVGAIGPSAAERLLARGVRPMRAHGPEAIADLLVELRALLSGTPPVWLRRALAARGASAGVAP